MTAAKQYYRTYQADDQVSELSRELIKQILNFEPVHVLDFGCGTGKHLSPLHAIDICTIGIDISPLNVYKAIHKYNLPFVACGDETYLRNLCNVDVVFTCSVLDHIENIDEIIQEFKRIVNKAIIIAETTDIPFEGGQFYYSHRYEDFEFELLSEFEWHSEADKCNYKIWIWKK